MLNVSVNLGSQARQYPAPWMNSTDAFLFLEIHSLTAATFVIFSPSMRSIGCCK